MAAIAAATIGSFLNFGLPLLRKAVGKNLQEDVRSISREMDYIRASFRDHAKSTIAPDEVMELWLKDMKLLAYDIEDFTDRFLSRFSCGGSEARRSFLHRSWRFVSMSVHIGGTIGDLKKRSAEARRMFDAYVVKDDPTHKKDESAYSAGGEVSLPDDDKLRQLVLRPPSESEKKLKVISIIGYGALGNTLLVDKVYYDDELRSQFHVCARVNATGKDVDQVLRELYNQVRKKQNGVIGTSNTDGRPRKSLVLVLVMRCWAPFRLVLRCCWAPVRLVLGKDALKPQETQCTSDVVSLTKLLRSYLKNGRFLIAIDNVSAENLKSIIQHCGDEVDGNFITTTDYTKAIHCNCSSVAPESSTSTAQYLMIKELMIKELTNKEYQQETKKHIKELQAMLVSNYRKSVSSLDLEQCLLYFCMFPHAHIVRWNLLLMRYLAEGIAFDQPEKQTEGELCSPLKYLKEFMDQHDVQPIQVSKNGGVKRCQLPVMMLNHISGESKSKSFFTLFCGSTDIHGLDAHGKDPVRRLSLHPKSAENGTLSLPSAGDVSRLRTLAVFHSGSLDKISELSKYELLRVLDLKECAVLVSKKHLKKICDLLLLKYLSLGDSIDEVPREIAKLQWLETLVMTKIQIVHVPMEVMELPRLKHLLGKFQLCKNDITPKKKKQLLSKASQLERLSGFVISDSGEFQQLMKYMKKLRKVKIWYDAENWTADVSTAIKGFIRKRHTLSLDKLKKGSLSIDCKRYPIEFVESLKDPGTLTSLKLCGDLKTFLNFKGSKLTGIEELCLSGTNLSGNEIVRVVRLFRPLKCLKLVEDELCSLEIPADCLHGLQRLCLVGVRIMDEIKVHAESLVCLVSLHMLFKTQGDLSGIDITRLEKLEEIALHSGVPQAIKEDWQKKASQHRKKPKVLFVQSLELIGGNASNLGDEHSTA